MSMECSAIILIIGIMAFSTMRSGRYYFSLGVLPLAIVPFIHLMGNVIARGLSALTPLSYFMARIGVDIAALVVACILFGIMSVHIKGKKQRLSYLVLCGGFTLIFTCVLVARLIAK